MISRPRRMALLAGLLLLIPAGGRGAEVSRRKGLEIAITSPRNGDFRYGRSEITAEVKADDPAKIQKVEFTVDDRLIFIDKEPPYACVFDFGTEPRSFVIRARAYHQEGVTVTDTVITRKVILNYAVRIDRVVVSATAQDGDHRFVLDLKREDFRLEEEGKPQTLVDFYLEQRPVTLCLVLDSSGSMQGKMEKVHQAAGGFVEVLRPEDQALVIDFDEKVFLLQDFTSDRALLREAIDSTYPEGGTAIYDALFAAFRKLKNFTGRKAIVLLTDGEDTSSNFSYARVLEAARTNDVLIFPIGLGIGLLQIEGRGTLKELAEETGGRAYFPGGAEELQGVYQSIAEELRSQYYLSYSPSNENWDGQWRRIQLSVPGRKDLEIRTRKGYYAVRRAPPPESPAPPASAGQGPGGP